MILLSFLYALSNGKVSDLVCFFRSFLLVFQAGRLHKLYRSWEDNPDIGFVMVKVIIINLLCIFSIVFSTYIFLHTSHANCDIVCLCI